MTPERIPELLFEVSVYERSCSLRFMSVGPNIVQSTQQKLVDMPKFRKILPSKSLMSDIVQITKSQHIVPQLHLKRFLAPGELKLKRFNPDELRIEKPQSPRSACSAEFHYALKPGEYDEYSQVVEKAFGDIEDWYAKNIDRIEKQLIDHQKPSDTDRYAISWVIANFYFRGHRHRNEIKALSQEIADWLYPGDSQARVIAEKTSHATNAAFDEGHANTLTHKHWKILINQSIGTPFITSDEAVIEIADKQIPKAFLFRGSFLHQTQIFHLSPRVAIIASFPFAEEMHGQTEFMDVSNNPAGVAENNLLYINHCYEYAYAPNDLFFKNVIDFEKKRSEKNIK